VLHWAARLPQADGRVGTYGPSYLGIDQLLLRGRRRPAFAAEGTFPMVSANDIYRDTSFMGGMLDFEFSETYLGLTGAENTTNPITDTASDPTLLSDLASIETDHVNGLGQLSRGGDQKHPTGGDEAYDGSYWQARNPQNVLARIVANPHPRLPGRRRVRHLPPRTANRSTTPSSRTRGMAAARPRPCCPASGRQGAIS